MKKEKVIGSNYHPVKLLNTSDVLSNQIEIEYVDGDELIHFVDDEGTIHHNPNYPDPDCPCYNDDEQGDTSSELVMAMGSYQHDFYSITPAGYNTGGSWLERRVAECILRGAV
ncbi:MAG: hypothetical protein PVS3B3_27020 [Ktedonobacteraceae bacterium]